MVLLEKPLLLSFKYLYCSTVDLILYVLLTEEESYLKYSWPFYLKLIKTIFAQLFKDCWLVELVTRGPASFCLQQLLYTGDFSRQEDRHLMAAEIPNIKPDILIIVSFAKLYLSVSDYLWIRAVT